MELGDEYFMKQALKEANRAFDEDEVPIGAVVVIDQQVIGRGYNQNNRLNDATAHAEILALTAAFNSLGSQILEDATIYVSVEPCAMCAGALKWARIGKVVYGAEEPKSGFTLYQPSLLHPKTTFVGGILRDEAAFLMQDFFRQKRDS